MYSTPGVLHIRYPSVVTELTFDSNDQNASQVTGAHNITMGGTAVLNASGLPANDLVPTFEGHVFHGWYNESDMMNTTAVKVLDDTGALVPNTIPYVSSIGNWTYCNSSDPNKTPVYLTLYAAWSMGVTNLTFNATDGFTVKYGNISFGDSEVKDNATGAVLTGYPLVPTSPKTGHHFGGWNATNTSTYTLFNENGYLVDHAGTYVKSSQKWNTTESYLSLDAYWIANLSILQFNTTGMSATVKNGTIKFNTSTLTGPTAAQIIASKKTGYTLNGWNVSGMTTIINRTGQLNGTVSGYLNAGTWVNASANGTVFALTPYLVANTTNITLNNVSALAGSTLNVTATFDAAMPAIAVLPKRTGYTFHGYYNSTDKGTTLKTQFYNETGASMQNWTIDVSTYTLYANWTENTYTIKFSNTSNSIAGNGTMSSVKVNYTENYTLPDSTFTAPANKGFDGWLNGTQTYNASKLLAVGQMVNRLNSTDGGVWTFYANWSDGYTVKYEAPDNTSGVVPVDETLYIPSWNTSKRTVTVKDSNISRNGYTLAGWNNSLDGKVYTKGQKFVINKSVTLTAVWKPIEYTITYQPGLNGDTYANYTASSLGNPTKYNITMPTITLVNATRSGYTFTGWVNTSSPTQVITTIPQGSFGNLDLTANWTVTEVTDTADSFGSYDPVSKNHAFNFARVSEQFTADVYGTVVLLQNLTANSPVTFRGINQTQLGKSVPTKANYNTYTYGLFDIDAQVSNVTNLSQIKITMPRIDHDISAIYVYHLINNAWKEMTYIKKTGTKGGSAEIIAQTDSFCPIAIVTFTPQSSGGGSSSKSKSSSSSTTQAGTVIALSNVYADWTPEPTSTPNASATSLPIPTSSGSKNPFIPTAHSPAPLAGLIAGIGAVAVVFGIRHIRR